MNILITGAWQGAKENIPNIEKLGHSVVFLQMESDLLPCAYEWVEGIIGNGIFLHHPIEKFVNLKYIQLTSAGFDRVPLEYIKEHSIEIHNAKGVYSIPMAEFAVSGVLQIYKQSRFFYENQKQHRWEKHRNLLELYDKTVTIVGCGSVGTECAKRFQAFGCNVVGVDISPVKSSYYNKIIELSNLSVAIRNADILVLTLPLTKESKHIIGTNAFDNMKNDIVIVNIARGAVMDTAALCENIHRIKGAVLDVFEEEPLPADSILWDCENVIITPHNSFVGDNNRINISNVIINNLGVKK